MPVTRCCSLILAPALPALVAALLVSNTAWSQDAPATPPSASTQTVVEALSQPPAQNPPAAAAKSGTFTPAELEQMVASIALYPDPLLAQVLMGSTYPLEIVEAARWSKANSTVTGDAVATALQNEDWDPSVKTLATFPDVLAMMDENLDWTQKLGDAFLAQQAALMDAVQRLRARAKEAGTLMSSKEQTVKVEPAPPPTAEATAAAATTTPPAEGEGAAVPVDQTTIIKIEPADPEVVYVPTYNPTVVYGTWPYPAYPPYYYYPPMYPPGSMWFSFTAGVIIGGAFWGNCNWGWGGSDIDIDINNNFNRNNIGNNVGNNVGADGKWKHDPSHRKGAQYRDSATQERFGRNQNANSVQSREAFRGRAEQGRRDIAAGGATQDLAGNRLGGGASAGTRDLSGNRAGNQGGAAANRPTQPSTANRSAGTTNRSTSTNRSSTSRGSEAFRSSGSGSYTRSASQRGYSSRSSGGFSRPMGGGGGRRR